MAAILGPQTTNWDHDEGGQGVNFEDSPCPDLDFVLSHLLFVLGGGEISH